MHLFYSVLESSDEFKQSCRFKQRVVFLWGINKLLQSEIFM